MNSKPTLDASRWKAMAKLLLPEVYAALLLDEQWNEGCSESEMHFFFMLLPLVKNAHRNNERDFLLRAHAFADWCMQQPEQEIYNPAGVAFYEHLVDDLPEGVVMPWLSARTFAQIESLIDLRLSAKRSADVKKAYEKRQAAEDKKFPGVIANAERQAM